jgi:hypothetical protein
LRRQYRRNTLIYYDPEAVRRAAADKRAAGPHQVTVNVTVNAPPPPVPDSARAIENHYHQHNHLHLHLHGFGREVQAAVAAAVTRRPRAVTDSEPAAIEPRNVTPGDVISDRQPAIEKRKAAGRGLVELRATDEPEPAVPCRHVFGGAIPGSGD